MSIGTYMPTAASRAGVITSDQTRVYSVGGRAVEAQIVVETWNDRKNQWELSTKVVRKNVNLAELVNSIEDFWTNDTNLVLVTLRRR